MKENEELKAIIGEMTIANEILKKIHAEEKVSSVNEMYNNGIEVKKACYYSGIELLKTKLKRSDFISTKNYHIR